MSKLEGRMSFGAAFARLVRPVGIRDQRPRHADKIAGTVGDGGFGLRRRRDAADRHHRLAAGGGPHLLVNVEEMARAGNACPAHGFPG